MKQSVRRPSCTSVDFEITHETVNVFARRVEKNNTVVIAVDRRSVCVWRGGIGGGRGEGVGGGGRGNKVILNYRQKQELRETRKELKTFCFVLTPVSYLLLFVFLCRLIGEMPSYKKTVTNNTMRALPIKS